MLAKLLFPEYTFRQEQGTVHIVLRVRGAVSVESHYTDTEMAVTVVGAEGPMAHMHVALYDPVFPDACRCDASSHNVVITLTKRKFGLRWRGIAASVLPAETATTDAQQEQGDKDEEEQGEQREEAPKGTDGATTTTNTSSDKTKEEEKNEPKDAKSKNAKPKDAKPEPTAPAPIKLTNDAMFELD